MVTRAKWNEDVEELLKTLKNSKQYKNIALKLLNDAETLRKRAESKRRSNSRIRLMNKISGNETIRVNKAANERLKSLLSEAIKLVEQ